MFGAVLDSDHPDVGGVGEDELPFVTLDDGTLLLEESNTDDFPNPTVPSIHRDSIETNMNGSYYGSSNSFTLRRETLTELTALFEESSTDDPPSLPKSLLNALLSPRFSACPECSHIHVYHEKPSLR